MSPAAAVRAPGVPRTLALALLSRVPLSAIGLLLVLQVRHLGHSYTLAGACSGACALGMAIGSPVLGRIIDRAGQAAVLSATGAAVVAVTALFAIIPAGAPAPLFLLVAALIGATQPPVGSCVRVLWRRMLDGPGFSALVTLDASLQELAFLSGPLLLIGLASGIGPAAALTATAAITGVVAALFALLPETRRFGDAEPRDARASATAERAWRSGGVRLLLLVSALMGVAFGATELGLVTTADHHGARGASGLLFALWGVGSFVGGVVWTRKTAGRDQAAAMPWLLLILGVTSALIGALPTIALVGLGITVAGAAVAPLFGVVYSTMGDVAPAGALTEAFTLETSAITAGIALGSAVAGAGASAFGAPATFVLAGAAFLIACAAVRISGGVGRAAV
jgi:MFS family permease